MPAYLKGYEHDIFISYSHLDNQRVFDNPNGWVDEFYANLRVLLSMKMGVDDAIKIWWDERKLDGNIVFDPVIQNAVNGSAILLCLNSRGYLNSKYCQEELDFFHKKNTTGPLGLKMGERSRIFNVLLYNISFNEWPPQINGTTGFPFHGEYDEGNDGRPFAINSQDYKDCLEGLAEVIVKAVKEFHGILNYTNAPAVVDEEFTIYFGEVSGSGLLEQRSKTVLELEKQGFKIVTGIPPPSDAEGHENRVKKELTTADLSVHLLDQYEGKKIEGEDKIWYPQKQAELSLKSEISKLIWIPADVNINGIEEEKYKAFMQDLANGGQSSGNTSFIRGPRGILTKQIADLSREIKKQKQLKPKEKQAVLLDTHFNDQRYAVDLYKDLLDNQIQPFLNPQEDDPVTNIDMLEKRISQVSKIIFFYGKVGIDWVLHRMIMARQFIINNNYPDKEFYVYMVPPPKNPDDIIRRQEMLKVKVINNSVFGDNPPKLFFT